MNFSAWSIRNPIAPLLAFVILMVVGWTSFNALPITRFPNIDVPLVGITVAQPGAAPAEMENQVTREIEDAVAGINGVKNVSSTVVDGVSTTVVEFRMEGPPIRRCRIPRTPSTRFAAACRAISKAPSWAYRCGRSGDHDLCRRGSRDVPGGAELVRG